MRQFFCPQYENDFQLKLSLQFVASRLNCQHKLLRHQHTGESNAQKYFSTIQTICVCRINDFSVCLTEMREHLQKNPDMRFIFQVLLSFFSARFFLFSFVLTFFQRVPFFPLHVTLFLPHRDVRYHRSGFSLYSKFTEII